jgi:hypothetical protein
VVGPVVLAVFDGLLGAGLAYYAGFLLPERAARGGWTRVRGLLGTALGVAVGGGAEAGRVFAGVAIAGVALLGVRRVEVAASPESTEELSSSGYLPFGVGLALAAGVLAFTGGAERMRQAFAELAPMLGLL